MSNASIYIREVAKYAFKYSDSLLMLIHNHSSDLFLSSEEDKQLTFMLIN